MQFVGQKNEKLNLSCVLDLPVLPEQKKKKSIYSRLQEGSSARYVCREKANLLRQLKLSHKYRNISPHFSPKKLCENL